MDLQNFVGYGSQTLSYLTFADASAWREAGAVPAQVPINASGIARALNWLQQRLVDHFGVAANSHL